MNKFLKIGLAVILLGIGAVIAFGIASGENFLSYVSQDETFTYVEKLYDEDEFDHFDMSLDNKEVTILPTTDTQIKITYYESETNYLTFTPTGSTLQVENISKWYFHLFNFDFLTNPDYYKFYLYLPDTMTINLDISTTNGRINISDLSEIGILSLSTSNGEMHLDNIETSGSISLHSSNGALEGNNVVTLNDIDFVTSNGRIDIDGMTGADISLRTSNGKIECANIESNDLELRTSNGNIEITVPGLFEDYYLRMSTTNGSYYLDGDKVVTNSYHDNASKLLDCSTSNGNITVNFSN